MNHMTNATKLAGRAAKLSNDLRGEADRWSGERRRDLLACSAQLGHSIGMTLREPDAVSAIVQAGTNVLVRAMGQRLERDTAAFLADPIGFAHE